MIQFSSFSIFVWERKGSYKPFVAYHGWIPISLLGIEELKAVLADSHWPLKHEQITSLNVKYSAIWNVDFE